jgi:hypothetical protein
MKCTPLRHPAILSSPCLQWRRLLAASAIAVLRFDAAFNAILRQAFCKYNQACSQEAGQSAWSVLDFLRQMCCDGLHRAP